MPFPGHDIRYPRSADTSAFDRLYAVFAPRVLAYLLRLTGGRRAEAEDLTQETFLAAYAARSEFSGSNPLAWLFGVARRRQRDAFRASAVRPTTAPIYSEEIAGDEQPLSEDVTRRVVLKTALHRLEALEREAVTLVIIQGLTYGEAAGVMEEPIGTVKWRVHTGTKRLRRLLSGAFVDEENASTTRKEVAPHVETKRTKTAAV